MNSNEIELPGFTNEVYDSSDSMKIDILMKSNLEKRNAPTKIVHGFSEDR